MPSVELEAPAVTSVRVASLNINLISASLPNISYTLEFGTATVEGFAVAYSRTGIVEGEALTQFLASFTTIESQFLAFLSALNRIPALRTLP